MSLRAIVDWCAERLPECATAIEAAGGKRPHVYRWWEAGMYDPAAYLWMEPVQTTETVDPCTIRDDVRMVLCFTVDPTSGTGEDYLSVETIVDAVLPVIDGAIPALSRTVRRKATRQGFRVVRDDSGGDSAPKPLVVEVPLTVPLFHDTPMS